MCPFILVDFEILTIKVLLLDKYLFLLMDRNNVRRLGRGPKLERWADKMREIIAMLGWLTPLYLVCVLCQSA